MSAIAKVTEWLQGYLTPGGSRPGVGINASDITDVQHTGLEGAEYMVTCRSIKAVTIPVEA